MGEHPLYTVETRLLDANGGVLDKEAMKQKIFRFNPGLPCEKLGIKPVDLSTVGSTVQDAPLVSK